MSGSVDHIGIAVRDIEKSILFFQEVFGAKLLRKNVVEEQKLISGVISLGSINLELMQSTESNSIIDKFIKKNGEGVHHISIQVEDLDRFLGELDSKNIKILSKIEKSDYKIAFMHPESAFGVLIEVIERLNASNKER
ncbi:MAG: VOC family protein [Deltaproteobacteria bacterium]|nr:VOC family protein [Deltaproteobacteria bacterium]